MTFGKHLGKRYADVPLSYLRWMIGAKCKGAKCKGAKYASAEIGRRQRSAREVPAA